MSITVANLIAQVGADLTQFKLGMNEVDARLAQVKVRGEQAMKQVGAMRTEASRQSNIAANLRAQRLDLAPLIASQRQLVAAARADATAYKAVWDQAQAAQVAAMRSGDAALKASARAAVAQAKLAYRDIAADAKLAEIELRAMEARAASLARRTQYANRRSGSLLSSASSVEQMSGAAEDVSIALARRRAQDAAEHRTRALNNIAGSAMTVGAVAEVGLGAAAEVGANFNQMMVQTAHNTQLTTQGLVVMNATVKQLGLESGASFEELAHGFRLLTDYGFNATKSQQMLRAAMKGSIATGTDLATTAELLAKATKEFNLPAEQSNKTMALLVETGRRSTLTMDQMVNVGGKLYATAANMGMSFVEANAALITFTQHGLSASQAATQLTNDVNKITHPVKQVRDLLGELDKWTGKKLADDFNSVGFRARHMKGVFDDIVKTFDSLTQKQREQLKVQTPSDLAGKIFPNLRGTVGAVIATGTGFKDFQTNIDNLTKSLGKGGQIDDMYAESMKQLNQQMGRMQNAGTILASTVANALTPSVLKLTNVVVDDVKQFDKLPTSTKNATVEFIALAGVTLIVFGTVGKLIVGIGQLKTAMIELGIVEQVTLGFGALKTAAVGLFESFGLVAGGAATFGEALGLIAVGPGAIIVVAIAALALLAYGIYQVKTAWDQADQSMADLSAHQNKIASLGERGALIVNQEQIADALSGRREALANYTQIANDTRNNQRGLKAHDDAVRGAAQARIDISNFQAAYDKEAARLRYLSKTHQGGKLDRLPLPLPNAGNLPYTGPPATGAQHYGDGDDSKSKKGKEGKESTFQQAMDQARQKLDSLRQAYYGMFTEGDAADVLWERQSGNLKLVTARLYEQILAQAKLNDEMRKYKSVQSDIDAASFDAKKRKIDDAGGPNKNLNELMLEFTDPKGKYAHAWNTSRQGVGPAPIVFKNGVPTLGPTTTPNPFADRYAKQVNQLIAQAKGTDAFEAGQALDKDMGEAKDFAGKPLEKSDTPQEQAIAFLKEHAAAYKALQVTGKTAVDVLVAANIADAKTLQGLLKPGEDAVHLFADLYAARVKDADAAKERAKTLDAEKTEGIEADKYLSDSLRKAKDDLLKASSNKDDVKEGARSEYLAGYQDKNKTLFADPNVSQKEKDRLVQVANAQFELVYATNLQAKAAIEVRDINKQVDKGLKDISDTMHHVTDGITVTDAQWKMMSKSQQDAFNKLKQMTQVKSLMSTVMEGTEQIVYNSMMRIREHGFKGIFTQIIQDFDNMLFEMAAKWLSSQFLQLLQNQIPTLMGMAFGAAASGSGGATNGVSITNEPITANALGGPLERGKRYLVGENQAEYVGVDSAGRMHVDPANRGTRGGSGGGGGGDTHIHQSITVLATDARSFANQNTQNQIQDRSAAAARLAMNRNR